MSEMVERVAESLFVQHYFPAPALWVGEPEQRKQFYRDMARAAIEAMREPTEAMATVGWEEPRPHSNHAIYRDALFEAHKVRAARHLKRCGVTDRAEALGVRNSCEGF